MSETKDISRKRLADFLAARLRARMVNQTKTQQPRTESATITSSRTEQRVTPIPQP
jgi:hypothetical protein